uniref:OSK domain-containing protein n=1 Tax=Amphiprion percula TaxID=161767 RepID=A0A3P8RR90_AMPPE
MTQSSGQEKDNRQLISTTIKDEEACGNSRKSTGSPPWNLLGAKPKHTSGMNTADMERQATGRIQHAEITDETGWPALPSHSNISSTPIQRREESWTVATTRNKSKQTKETEVQLENRFAVLQQDPDTPKESSSLERRQRYDTERCTKRLQNELTAEPKRLRKELTTGPQTLIVGDRAVNDLKHFSSKKNTKVLCFNNDMVSDISKKILKIAAEHPTAKSLVIHTGALDVEKQQSEVLKEDFMDLLNKVRGLKPVVYVSGPLPTVRRGDERFSRLMLLNRWLKATCAAQSINFIDNFNIFWERRHLFKANGIFLNRSGLLLLCSNIFYSVLLKTIM